VVVNLLLVYVLFEKGIKMVNRDEDDIVQVTENVDYDEIGSVSL
jgi:hypothetical protein